MGQGGGGGCTCISPSPTRSIRLRRLHVGHHRDYLVNHKAVNPIVGWWQGTGLKLPCVTLGCVYMRNFNPG